MEFDGHGLVGIVNKIQCEEIGSFCHLNIRADKKLSTILDN